MKDFISSILMLLLFLPSVTFSLISAEVFPWALIFVFINLKGLGDYGKFLIISSSLISFVPFIYGYCSNLPVDSLRVLMSYWNALLIFIFILNSKNITKIHNVLNKFIIFITIWGVAQLLLGTRLDLITNLFVSRGGAILSGGRGVGLFSSEPSRAGLEYVFLMGTVVLTTKMSSLKKNLCNLFMLLFIIVVIRSSSSLLYALIYLISYYRLKLLRFIPFVLLFAPFVINSNIRSIELFYEIFKSTDINVLFKIILNQSGFRLISVISSYWYGFHNILGGGIGLWKHTSIIAMKSTGIPASEINYFILFSNGCYSAVRPTSFVANLMIDVGLIGTIFLVMFIIKFIRHKFSILPLKNILPLLLTFLFYIFFLGTVGNPIPFICIALVIKHYAVENNSTVYLHNRENA